MKINYYTLPGLIGLIIYGILFIYTLFKVLNSSFIIKLKIKYFNYKISFHFIFLFYCLCEIIYSLSLFYYKRITPWGFLIHFTALFLNVLFFAMVVNLWGFILNFYRAYWKFSVLSSILIFINFVSLIVSIYYIAKYHGFGGFSSHITPYVTVLLVHVFSLLVFSIVLLLYGCHISHKITQSYNQTSQRMKEKLYLVFRINVVLSICCFCYLLRACTVSLLVYEQISGGSYTNMPSVFWFLLNAWIPTVGPGLIFLHTMKTTKTSSSPTQSLLASNLVRYTNNPLDIENNSPEDRYTARYSWYYEEKERLKSSENHEDSTFNTRISSISMINTKIMSFKDSMFHRESTT